LEAVFMFGKKIVFWEGVALLVGTIIGAGYLVLPYSVLQAGALPNLFWLVFFGCCVTILHLLYAEIVVATPENHRLPGYVGAYLGKGPELVSIASFIFGIFGGLLVYLLLGGRFLQLLIAPALPIPQQLAVVVFWFALSVLLISKLGVSSKINLGITTVTVSLFAIVSAVSVTRGTFDNFSIPAGHSFFFPYGLVLYALVGSLAIPEIIKLLKKRNQSVSLIRPIGIVGTIIPVIVYALFAFAIFSASGSHTTQEAIEGLRGIVPNWLVWATLFLAFLEIVTSYFTFGISIIETFRKDFSMKKIWATLLAIALPIVLFGIGIDDFVKLIGVLGSVLATIDSLAIILVYRAIKKQKPEYKPQVVALPQWALIPFALVFLIGGVLGFVYSL